MQGCLSLVVALTATGYSASPASAQAATLTLDPTTGPAGTSVTATLEGVPNCDDFFQVDWSPPVSGEFTEDVNTLTARGAVPAGTPAGTYVVLAACNGPGVGAEVEASFTVSPSAATTSPTTSPPTTSPTTSATSESTSVPPTAEVTTVPATIPADGGDDSVVPLLVGIAGAVLLIAMAVLALRRRRRGPPPAAERGLSPAAPVRRSRTFERLADDLLGDGRIAPLAAAGPAAARVAEACGSEAVANPLLATLVWETFAAQDTLGDLLRKAGGSNRALEGQLLVVRHAGETRHDLLVLDPGLPADGVVVATPVELRRETMSSVALARPLSWKAQLERGDGGPWAALDEATIVQAIGEAADEGTFGLIVTAPPRTVLTQVPSPPWQVFVDDKEQPVATAGVVASARDGSFAVTTALHAVKGRSTVSVDGRPGRLKSAHEPTDSCLIEVGGPPPKARALGRKGPLRAVSPRQNEEVAFEGIASGRKTTTVTAWDLSILTVQELVGSKVYTTPETMPGDSGSALIDSSDHIVGFAVYRSAFGEAIEYSAWVWADQVFGAHDLRIAH